MAGTQETTLTIFLSYKTWEKSKESPAGSDSAHSLSTDFQFSQLFLLSSIHSEKLCYNKSNWLTQFLFYFILLYL